MPSIEGTPQPENLDFAQKILDSIESDKRRFLESITSTRNQIDRLVMESNLPESEISPDVSRFRADLLSIQGAAVAARRQAIVALERSHVVSVPAEDKRELDDDLLSIVKEFQELLETQSSPDAFRELNGFFSKLRTENSSIFEALVGSKSKSKSQILDILKKIDRDGGGIFIEGEAERLLGSLENDFEGNETISQFEARADRLLTEVLRNGFRVTTEEYNQLKGLYKCIKDSIANQESSGGRLVALYARGSRDAGARANQYLARLQEMHEERGLLRNILRRINDMSKNESSPASDNQILRTATGRAAKIKRSSKLEDFDLLEDRSRVFSLGDFHGSYEAFEKSLLGAGLIQKADDGVIQWTQNDNMRDTKVVLLGDIFDRGFEGTKILDAIKNLEAQGAQFSISLGNHESIIFQTMFGTVSSSMLYGWIFSQGGLETLQGLQVDDNFKNTVMKDLEQVTSLLQEKSRLEKYRRTLSDPEESELVAHAIKDIAIRVEDFKKDLFEYKLGPIAQVLKNNLLGDRLDSKYGNILKNLKVAEQIDDTLYLHSELSPQLLQLLVGHGVDAVNATWSRAFEKAAFGSIKADNTTDSTLKSVGARRLDSIITGYANDFMWSRSFSEGKIASPEGKKVYSRSFLARIAKYLKLIGINNLVIGHTPSTLFANPKKADPRLFAGARDSEQYNLKIDVLDDLNGDGEDEFVNLIFNDIAASTGVNLGSEARVGGVMIDPDLAKSGNILLFNENNIEGKSIALG